MAQRAAAPALRVGAAAPRRATRSVAPLRRLAAPPRRAAARGARAQLTLWTHPASRGKIVEWYLAELGGADELGVDVRVVDMAAREHKSEAFLKVNPFGKLPALSDGSSTHVFESGAMLLYLFDRFELSGTCDEAGAAEAASRRGRAAAWVLFANSTMGNAIYLEHMRDAEMPNVMDGLERVLSQHAFLEPEGFTVADVAVGGLLMYVPMMFPQLRPVLARWPRVGEYVERLRARPACAATLAARIAGARDGSAPPPPPTRGGKPAPRA